MRTAAEFRAAAAASAGCRLVRVGTFDGEPSAAYSCDDGWAAARLLLALSRQSAGDPRVVRLAVAIRSIARDDDEAAARMLHAFVLQRVEFVREDVETYSGAGWLLSEIATRGRALGDCDCMAQLVYAAAKAMGLPVQMVILAGHDDGEPRHVLCRVAGEWCETTVAAEFGEHPVAAAARLGVQTRDDLKNAREITMGDVTDVVHSGDVSDADLDVLVREFQAEGLDPRVAFDVMFSESGFRASRRNGSGAPFAGLNQMGVTELAGFGLTLDQWVALPASTQLPIVRRFWHQRRESLAASKGGAMREIMYRDAPHLYAANFWPAGMRPVDATDYPLFSRADHPVSYAANRMIDANRDGVIAIDDMAAWLEERKHGAHWGEPERYAELAARVDDAIARASGGSEPGPGYGPAIASGLLMGGAIALARVILGG